MNPFKKKEAEIIRRLNEDDNLSDEERETLLDELAYLQFANVGSNWRIPR